MYYYFRGINLPEGGDSVKILLAQTMEYLYGYGGANKANRNMMEWFVKQGHECMVIMPETYMEGYEHYFIEKQEKHEIEVSKNNNRLTAYTKDGVQAYMVKGEFRLIPFLNNKIAEFQPDIIIISEEKTYVMMEEVCKLNIPTVYIAHSQPILPFGPEAFEQHPEAVDLYRNFDGIIAVSNYIKSYFENYANIPAKTIFFPSYGEGPYPYCGNFDNTYITAINPSALKGFPILVGLAKRFPGQKFLAVVTWGTREEEMEIMRSIDNITIMNAVEDVNIIYKQTKVFLMPSLWGEAFGQVVVEAMLRGIPVMSSNIGGLPEAKQGLDYILPVNPIRQYEHSDDMLHKGFKPVVPEQDIEPWVEALDALIHDRDLYERLSSESREKSTKFVENIGFDKFVDYFQELIDAKK